MHYKIDTKEKFNVLSLLDPSLSSNLVPELNDLIKKLDELYDYGDSDNTAAWLYLKP